MFRISFEAIYSVKFKQKFDKEKIYCQIAFSSQKITQNKFVSNKCIISSFKLTVFILFYKSSGPEMFCKKGVLRNFAKFTGKQMCQSHFLTKKRLLHKGFPLNFAKFLGTSFFMEHLWCF